MTPIVALRASAAAALLVFVYAYGHDALSLWRKERFADVAERNNEEAEDPRVDLTKYG